MKSSFLFRAVEIFFIVSILVVLGCFTHLCIHDRRSRQIDEEWALETIFRARLIIQGLEHYREDRGEYPANIGNLVPEYLKALPIVVEPNGTPDRWLYEKHGETYQLWVAFNHWISSHSALIYWPEQDYPDNVFNSKGFQRVGGWAFLGPYDHKIQRAKVHSDFSRSIQHVNSGDNSGDTLLNSGRENRTR